MKKTQQDAKKIAVSDTFDGGNINCLSVRQNGQIDLEIRKDTNADYCQWFYFRLTGAAGTSCRLNIQNAGAASYVKGWQDYQAVGSDDRVTWRRLPTDFDGTTLTIRHKPERDAVYYAYFAPYSLDRHEELICRSLADDGVRLQVLGQTCDGRDLDLLTITEAAEQAPVLWIIGRQHPGETMAEWWSEGFLDRLLDRDDPVARRIRQTAVVKVVPNMNPDGSFRGHLRTNAAGVNLNRAWAEPDAKSSPEVYYVRAEMHRTGVDFCLDVHGDEALPHNFLVPPLGIPSLNDRLREDFQIFSDALLAASPDFQTDRGYPPTPPGRGNLAICSNYIAETFGCPALTLEQPFKDTKNHPDPTYGWSPGRAKKFGAASLDAILRLLPRITANGDGG